MLRKTALAIIAAVSWRRLQFPCRRRTGPGSPPCEADIKASDSKFSPNGESDLAPGEENGPGVGEYGGSRPEPLHCRREDAPGRRLGKNPIHPQYSFSYPSNKERLCQEWCGKWPL